MKIISHRGVMGLAPENSLASIKIARNLGVDAIEVDVRLSKDNKLVVFHDQSLKRLAGKSTNISQLNYEQLLKTRLTNGELIPSLVDILKASKDTPVVIDAKGSEWSRPLSEALKSYEHKDTLSVISFNHEELRRFKSIDPKVAAYALAHANVLSTIKHSIEFNFSGIDIPVVYLPFVYGYATRRKLKVIIYTLDNRLIARFISSLFKDVKITTNRPDKITGMGKVVDS